MNRRARGSALLLVLWVSALLAALLAGVVASSRSQSEAALSGSERIRAELAAEAGLAHAVAGLRAPAARTQWVPDGRPYAFEFDGARVTVRVVDVSGLLDLNASSPDMFSRLLVAAGVGGAQADQLAHSITAWRDGSGDPGRPHGPFRAVEQLAAVPGMTDAVYARIKDDVTVFSGRNFPDVSYSGDLVLAAVQGVGADQAKLLVDGRRQRPGQPGAGNGQALGAVSNGPLTAGYGGVVERIFSTAEMPDGARVQLDVTLRLALTGGSARPYKVLDWRAGSADAS